MLLARFEPDDIPGSDFLDRTALTLDGQGQRSDPLTRDAESLMMVSAGLRIFGSATASQQLSPGCEGVFRALVSPISHEPLVPPLCELDIPPRDISD